MTDFWRLTCMIIIVFKELGPGGPVEDVLVPFYSFMF